MQKKYRGVDVSVHNGEIKWDKAAQEISFAMIRCGYGLSGIDTRFEENAKACKKLGIPFGIYLFSYAGTPEIAKQEAMRCIEIAKEFKPEIGIAFDFEDDSVNYITDKGYKATTDNIRNIADSFLSCVNSQGEFNPILYASKSYYIRYYEGLPYYLWLAQWQVTQPSIPCDMWQCTSHGKIDGIWNFVDIDYTDYIPGVADVPPVISSIENVCKTFNERYRKVADEVIAGKFGNGEARKTRLKAAGYDAEFVQALVNAILK